MRRPKRRWIVGALSLLAVALVPSARWLARRFLYPSRDLPRLAVPAGAIERRLVAADGAPVRVLELPGTSDRTVVHFHNNRETVESCTDFARAVNETGATVVLVEYRGYGASPATAPPTEEGLYLDAEAALDMLAARGVGPDEVILSGASLGTGVAAEMARRGRGSRLFLLTPYTSIPDIVSDVVPLVPAKLLVPDHFDTLSKAREIRIPTVVVHGDADEIVPFWMGKKVASSIDAATFVSVPGGHHGDLFQRERSRLVELLVGPLRPRR